MSGTLLKMDTAHSMSSHSIPQRKLYRDHGKGKVIADCVITTTSIAFKFTAYCLFSMFDQFMSTIENLLSKMYIEGALISKSRNIGLMKEYSIHHQQVVEGRVKVL